MKQGYNARLADALGMKHGKKKQSMKAREHESEGMEKEMGNRKYSGDKSMGYEHLPFKVLKGHRAR
jgi:hypothetical protein